MLIDWLKQLFQSDGGVTGPAQPSEAEISEAVSRLTGSPVRVKLVDTPALKLPNCRPVRTTEGFTVYIDRKNLNSRPQFFKGRVPPVLALLHDGDCTAEQTILNYGDGCLPDEVRIVFCAQAGSNHILIPDYDFLNSRGFEKLREWTQTGMVPWETRNDVVLWRGVTTGSWADAENNIQRLPRVQLCLLAKAIPQADVKIINLVQSQTPEPDQNILDEAGIMAEKRLPVQAWAGHKFAIDIDGNTNSFNTMLHRQTLGCCVLKVASPGNWRQWFYDDIKPWEHFVPVKSDLSDLAEIIAWCRDHDDECRNIAERGRAFANSLDFKTECKSAVERINAAFAPQIDTVIRD